MDNQETEYTPEQMVSDLEEVFGPCDRERAEKLLVELVRDMLAEKSKK